MTTSRIWMSWAIVSLLHILLQDVYAKIPEQIHISFGDDHSKMVIMWSSHDQVKGHVQYGEAAYDLSMTSAVSDVSKMPKQSSDALQYVHRVQLEGLKPGTEYYYRVYNDYHDNQVESDEFSFVTVTDDTTAPAKYIVYGDMGIQSTIPTYRDLEDLVGKSRDYTAIWHIGDLGYDLHSENGKVGDEFLRKIQPFAARVPYMTSPGNHEIPDDFLNYRTRFSMPGVPWPMPLDRMWYSYDIGLVHFISFSSETYFTYDEDYTCTQYNWLREDLIRANGNRDKVPWIIALGHRPMYCSNNNGDDCTNRFSHRWLRYGLEDLFHAQGVDLVVEAHEHSYERLWPVYQGKVTDYNYLNPEASVHVITGAAGNGEGVDWMSRQGAIQNDWSAFRADELSKYTFGRLVIENRTHLVFEQLQSGSDHVIDGFRLQQTNHGPFIPGVTCSGSSNIHPSCTCPAPIRYMRYIVIAIVLLVVVILAVVSVVCVCVCRRRRALPRDAYIDDDESLLSVK